MNDDFPIIKKIFQHYMVNNYLSKTSVKHILNIFELNPLIIEYPDDVHIDTFFTDLINILTNETQFTPPKSTKAFILMKTKLLKKKINQEFNKDTSSFIFNEYMDNKSNSLFDENIKDI